MRSISSEESFSSPSEDDREDSRYNALCGNGNRQAEEAPKEFGGRASGNTVTAEEVQLPAPLINSDETQIAKRRLTSENVSLSVREQRRLSAAPNLRALSRTNSFIVLNNAQGTTPVTLLGAVDLLTEKVFGGLYMRTRCQGPGENSNYDLQIGGTKGPGSESKKRGVCKKCCCKRKKNDNSSSKTSIQEGWTRDLTITRPFLDERRCQKGSVKIFQFTNWLLCWFLLGRPCWDFRLFVYGDRNKGLSYGEEEKLYQFFTLQDYSRRNRVLKRMKTCWIFMLGYCWRIFIVLTEVILYLHNLFKSLSNTPKITK